MTIPGTVQGMEIDGETKLSGVLGWPVAHSRSPRLHGFWFEKYQINGAYVPLPVKAANLAVAVKALPRMGFVGANVTVPHKQSALELCDRIDPVARRIGAVNVLVFETDGAIVGLNTDGFGFIENLKAGAPEWRREGPAVVLGAGGAARAILSALMDAGVPEIRLANRSRDRAMALQDELEFAGEVVDWAAAPAALDGATLLVNATSLGMTGAPALELALDDLPTGAVVNDAVYAPLETDLLRRARARGNPTVDGLGMLLHQARPAFAAWYGRNPEVTEELRRHVAADLLDQAAANR